MKPLLLLLGLSLAANAALYFTRPANDSKTAPASATSSIVTPPAVAGKNSAGQTNPTPTGAAHPHAAFWTKLEAGDPSVVESLRAAGWPDDALRALVTAYVYDLYRPRERALRPDTSQQEYWNQSSLRAGWNLATRKASRDLVREKHNLIKTLLGPSYVAEPSTDPRFVHLPPAVAESLNMIEHDYSVLSAEVRGDLTSGISILLPEDREKLAFLEKEKAADLAKVLTPEQLLDYELRNSRTAAQLRSTLTAFNPTEQEFRALFALQKQLADRLGTATAGMSVSAREVLNKAQAEIDAQAKQILPPDRYEDYVRAKDYDYRRLYQIADRLKLPPETAIAAYEVKADIEKRAREIKPTPGPDAVKQFTEARAALAQEAQKRLVDSLGQRGFDVYRENGAYWLNNLTASPTSPTSTRGTTTFTPAPAR